MIAFKGFTKDLTATLGKGVYQFEPGRTEVTEKSKTASTGFHCCENPIECMGWYSMYKGSRYFMVEAAGDINEDESEKIACTELTLIKELSIKELVGHGMMYMIQHPMRERWRQHHAGIVVTDMDVSVSVGGDIAIVRSANPKVKGVKGALLGLILEERPGVIAAAKLFEVGQDAKPDTWYTLTEDRKLVEVEDEV